LGQKVLVVVDNVNGFCEALRTAITSVSKIKYKSFTLLCCCPTQYWEHGGVDSSDVQQQIQAMANK
jgi:hypothetical protein